MLTKTWMEEMLQVADDRYDKVSGCVYLSGVKSESGPLADTTDRKYKYLYFILSLIQSNI